MRRIDRFNLTDLIGRELQSRMTYSDIDVYLKGYGVNVDSKKTSNTNSKWIYSKEVLADEPDEIILAIADELEIDHPYHGTKNQDISDSQFWYPAHFRLFLTHLSSFKNQTAMLQSALRRFCISAFVAHEDIEPTREWLNEIEKALFSMDALAAILMPGFHESNWTDHEVGVAVGRDVLIVPIRYGLDPYGFIGRYQGFQAKGKTIGQVAEALFSILLGNPKTKGRMLDCLIEQILLAGSPEDALTRIGLLRHVDSIPQKHGDKIRENLSSNGVLSYSKKVIVEINSILDKSGLELISKPVEKGLESEDIPF